MKRARSLIEWLTAKASEARGLAEHAEANRDGWFATMPPEFSAENLADAERFEQAAAALAELSTEASPLGAEPGPSSSQSQPTVASNGHTGAEPSAAGNLSHEEAIDAICGCAATVTVLSYEEAIGTYFTLRGLRVPA